MNKMFALGRAVDKRPRPIVLIVIILTILFMATLPGYRLESDLK